MSFKPNNAKQLHTLLPSDAIEKLQLAACSDPDDKNPFYKRVQVDKAIKSVKLKYPNYFK